MKAESQIFEPGLPVEIGKRNIKIDLFRILACLAVICLHVSSYVVTRDPSVTSFDWWIGNFADAFSRWCIPAFVMISGYFILSKPTHGHMREFYVKRANRILAPLVFWSFFYLGWEYKQGHLNLDYLATFLLMGAPNQQHLWYLFMLVGLYSVTPFLSGIIESVGNRELVTATAICFVITSINSSIISLQLFGSGLWFFPLNWVQYVGYYLAGILLPRAIRLKDRRQQLISGGIVIFCLFLIAIFTGILLPVLGGGAWRLMYSYLNPLVIIASLALFLLFESAAFRFSSQLEKIIEQISNLTFGIYLIHPIGMAVLGKIGISETSSSPIVSIPTTIFGTFLLSLCASIVIKRIPFIRKVI